MNSIFMYVLSRLERAWIEQTLKTHFGQNVFGVFGTTFAPMVRQVLAIILLAAGSKSLLSMAGVESVEPREVSEAFC